MNQFYKQSVEHVSFIIFKYCLIQNNVTVNIVTDQSFKEGKWKKNTVNRVVLMAANVHITLHTIYSNHDNLWPRQKLIMDQLQHYGEQQLLQSWGLEPSAQANYCNQNPVQPAKPQDHLPLYNLSFSIFILSVYLFLLYTCSFLALSQLNGQYITLRYYKTSMAPSPPTHMHTHTDFTAEEEGVVIVDVHRFSCLACALGQGPFLD